MNKLLLTFVAVFAAGLSFTQNLPSKTFAGNEFRVEYQNHNTSRAAGDSCGYMVNAYLGINKVVPPNGVWWNGPYYGASSGHASYSAGGQYFTAPQKMRISGFQFIYYFVPETTQTSMPVVGVLYQALADSTPGAEIGRDTIWVNQQVPGTGGANYAAFNFDNKPLVSTGGFFLSARTYTNDSLFFLSNVEGQMENLSFAFYEDVDVPANNAWYNYLSWGPAWDFDHLFFPLFKMEFSNDFAFVSDSICRGSDACVDVVNRAPVFYDSLWNRKYGNDSLYLAWKFDTSVEGHKMRFYCGTPATAGNYNVTMMDSIRFFNDAVPKCPVSITRQVFVVDSVFADFTYSNTGLQVDFTNTSMNADTYLWDFGNSNTSADTNATETYATNGIYTVHLKAYNQCFEDSSIQSVDLSTVGLKDFSIDVLKIYPNPTQNTVTISSNSSNNMIELTIINILGEVMSRQKINTSSFQVDMGKYGKGTYFFKIKNENQSVVRKVIVQ